MSTYGSEGALAGNRQGHPARRAPDRPVGARMRNYRVSDSRRSTKPEHVWYDLESPVWLTHVCCRIRVGRTDTRAMIHPKIWACLRETVVGGRIQRVCSVAGWAGALLPGVPMGAGGAPVTPGVRGSGQTIPPEAN
jgi:hypothetical protein